MDDVLDVFAWRNDPQTVAVSKTPGLVDQAGHMAWFARAVEDQDRLILIAEEDNRKLGMVRFDRAGDEWVVSINLAPAERRRGYSRPILNKALEMQRDAAGPCRLIAEIKDGNASSMHLFESAGFVRRDQRDGFHYLTREAD